MFVIVRRLVRKNPRNIKLLPYPSCSLEGCLLALHELCKLSPRRCHLLTEAVAPLLPELEDRAQAVLPLSGEVAPPSLARRLSPG
ncbi:unnamed protein product, partial [Musa acuminata var. zebrina]